MKRTILLSLIFAIATTTCYAQYASIDKAITDLSSKTQYCKHKLHSASQTDDEFAGETIVDVYKFNLPTTEKKCFDNLLNELQTAADCSIKIFAQNGEMPTWMQKLMPDTCLEEKAPIPGAAILVAMKCQGNEKNRFVCRMEYKDEENGVSGTIIRYLGKKPRDYDAIKAYDSTNNMQQFNSLPFNTNLYKNFQGTSIENAKKVASYYKTKVSSANKTASFMSKFTYYVSQVKKVYKEDKEGQSVIRLICHLRDMVKEGKQFLDKGELQICRRQVEKVMPEIQDDVPRGLLQLLAEDLTPAAK